MDAWLLLVLLGWMVSWAVVCASRTVQIDWMPTLLLGGAVVAVATCVRLVQRLRAHRRAYQAGDHVVYLVQKRGARPVARAERVAPSAAALTYPYVVRKLWTVVACEKEGVIEVRTAGGKRRVLTVDDPCLHRAGLVEALFLRLRWHKGFPPGAET